MTNPIDGQAHPKAKQTKKASLTPKEVVPVAETHYMYVLTCSDQSLYTGYTNNLEKRITTHNAGKGAKYTRARRPVKLIYYETFETKQEAMSAEALFKKKTRQAKLAYIQTKKASQGGPDHPGDAWRQIHL